MHRRWSSQKREHMPKLLYARSKPITNHPCPTSPKESPKQTPVLGTETEFHLSTSITPASLDWWISSRISLHSQAYFYWTEPCTASWLGMSRCNSVRTQEDHRRRRSWHTVESRPQKYYCWFGAWSMWDLESSLEICRELIPWTKSNCCQNLLFSFAMQSRNWFSVVYVKLESSNDQIAISLFASALDS